MLIRIDENTLREFPDDLAATIISSPSFPDTDADFTPQEVNILIHSIFGTHYDSSLSYDQNLERVREIYTRFGSPQEPAYEAAMKMVRKYNQEIDEKDIGVAAVDDVIQIQNEPLFKIEKPGL